MTFIMFKKFFLKFFLIPSTGTLSYKKRDVRFNKSIIMHSQLIILK